MSYGSSGNYRKSHKGDHKSAPCENASVESRYVLAALVNCNTYYLESNMLQYMTVFYAEACIEDYPKDLSEYGLAPEDDPMELVIETVAGDTTRFTLSKTKNEDGTVYGKISGQTSNGDWSFAGGTKINQTGTPATGSNGTIKFSGNKKYTITLPEGVPVDQVTIYGYCNSDGNESYLAELAGKTYGATDYVFPARDAAVSSVTHQITLDQPVTNQLTFTTGSGSQSCLKLNMRIVKPTGITETTFIPQGNSKFYNLQGVEVTNPTKGLYIYNGRKVVVK